MRGECQGCQMEQDNNDGQAWVTVSSFCRPCQPEPALEELIAADLARWAEAARDAGLPPEGHVRVTRAEEEITVEISPRLDAAFTPEQTLWKAI
ncbi:hypothetical protein DFW101_0846 [Solidesulfovibrio carbinoliphilus subsp. oakridgensis]|uniref:Uncharacterized protein n=1 Tax=Solidesulfovibrio carbinoliphilus subsp. oakridgensis TaxID=694327 RepID=G7Q5S5_9BACT|nr:hypothetical protein [Solidesulfovibrio carbinoliphilus]EHJ46862.1 hypothetical protein DFW101_0846 [Solidesulfovibrio carbinoliphilus subsp. oakridgensis]